MHGAAKPDAVGRKKVPSPLRALFHVCTKSCEGLHQATALAIAAFQATIEAAELSCVFPARAKAHHLRMDAD